MAPVERIDNPRRDIYPGAGPYQQMKVFRGLIHHRFGCRGS